MLADDQWLFVNGHEQGAEMLEEEMELHDDLEFDDDTALNCFELGQALDNLSNALVNDEGNIVAPAVGESSTASQKDVEMITVDDESDIQRHETIDIDVIDTEAESDAHSNEFGHSDLESE